MNKYILRIFVLAVLTFAGCGKDAQEKAIQKQLEEEARGKAIQEQFEEATGGTAQVDIFEDNVYVTGQTEEGVYAISTGEDIEIPADFPSDILIYQPSKVIHSTVTSEGQHVVLLTSDEVGMVTQSYKSQMVSQGWYEEDLTNMGQDTQVRYSKGERIVQITVSQIDDHTQIIIIFGNPAPLSVPADNRQE